MIKNIEYPYTVPVLLVKQPLGDFYVATLPASVLLDTAYSYRLKAIKNDDGTYRLEGSQRALDDTRLREIGRYIESVEAAFPNSIILAANYRESDGNLEEDTSNTWKLDINPDGKTAALTIPKPMKLAAIIDGQHRLFGFNYSKVNPMEFQLICSIYFDLPRPYQAFLFAVINSNQKSVNKSQTYELFGYNIDEEEPDSWTPDKLAVFLTRKLNTESDSPLKGHIIIAAENDIVLSLSAARLQGGWMVSTASVAEGILKLISNNSKTDSSLMYREKIDSGRSRSLLMPAKDISKTPLRSYYLNNNDKLIYTIVKNYFIAVKNVFWSKMKPGSYIIKTVGIQALFDILRIITPKAIAIKDISADYFNTRLSPCSKIDFTDNFFQASGTGRTRIRIAIEICLSLKNIKDDLMDNENRLDYERICFIK
jgi:DNA phosphorothioation-associated DGQHR protein 1